MVTSDRMNNTHGSELKTLGIAFLAFMSSLLPAPERILIYGQILLVLASFVLAAMKCCKMWAERKTWGRAPTKPDLD